MDVEFAMENLFQLSVKNLVRTLPKLCVKEDGTVLCLGTKLCFLNAHVHHAMVTLIIG